MSRGSAELAELVAQIKEASVNIAQADAANTRRIDAVEQSMNKMSLRLNRPGSWETADAAFPLEPWIMRKVSDGFRDAISNSIVAGDGLGRPMGFLNPNAVVPILDTSPSTPAGQLTWQDLFQLKYDVPTQWHAGGSFFMNQRTWALIATMSDALGRPLWTQLPGGQPGFVLNGSPVQIITQMPDCLPGHTPVALGNLRQAYTLVVRQATTMRPDPFTAGGWCAIFRFEVRACGNLTCATAMRLLRIR